MKRSDVLKKADELINGDRAEAYGNVEENFTRTAKGWSVILGTEVSPEQVALCMAWVKISRLTNRPHDDGYVDAAGYIALAGELSG